MGIGYFPTLVLCSFGSSAEYQPEPLPGEKSMGDHLKYKNQYYFQYDTTKNVYQFLRLFTVIKLLS